MQFIVFAAFAIVLSVPESGPPWATLTAPAWVWAGGAGQVILAGLIGRFSTRLVRAKLENEPAWLPSAQRRLARANATIRTILLLDFAAFVYFTGGVRLVRGWTLIEPVWGLDECLILLPFFGSIAAAWIALYPADRAIRQVSLELRLWASAPARPVWPLRSYLSFMFRQHVLIIAVPMVPIVVANDFVARFAGEIRSALFGLAWGDQAVLIAMAGLIFLFAPVMLRYVWHTRPLPDNELRQQLEAVCRRVRLSYREILIWESDGMVVNAAVMGLLKPVRYVLLSDGLLEMMDDRKIEAVFGHEAGHIKCRHIQYYLLFAVLSMLIVGGIMELAMSAPQYWPDLVATIPHYYDYLQVVAMALIVVFWVFGFGFISRRFEWQADLFGARCVTPGASDCERPCVLHGTAIASPSETETGKAGDPLCATAAATFADALHRIAVLNGIPVEARSWRHASIAHRMRMLREYGYRPERVARLERGVKWIKAGLLLGVAAGLAIALKLYWP